MLECTDIRQCTTNQSYKFYDISKDTTIEQLILSVKYCHSDLLVVKPEDLIWQNCQYNGFAGFGIFEVRVCVHASRWHDGTFKYEPAHVLFLGDSVQKIQEQAIEWFRINRDLRNQPYVHHNSKRKVTPMLYAMKHYEAFVPKEV